MQTTELEPGTVVHVPATLNSSAFSAMVESVEPWILTAGPNAGEQAKDGRGKNARPLFSVRLVTVQRTAPSLRPMREGSVDALEDATSVRLMAVTADHEWSVA